MLSHPDPRSSFGATHESGEPCLGHASETLLIVQPLVLTNLAEQVGEGAEPAIRVSEPAVVGLEPSGDTGPDDAE